MPATTAAPVLDERCRTTRPPLDPEATVDLLELIRAGDREALNRLLERCVPPLRRWAHGRVPEAARGAMETSDLVQETILAAIKRLDGFDPRHQGALQAYLRQAVMNRVRDLARFYRRRPIQVEVPDSLPAREEGPLDKVIGKQNVERYERAVQRLAPEDREAIIARLELQYSYEELAVVLSKPSVAAARMAVTRAMKRLVAEMVHA